MRTPRTTRASSCSVTMAALRYRRFDLRPLQQNSAGRGISRRSRLRLPREAPQRLRFELSQNPIVLAEIEFLGLDDQSDPVLEPQLPNQPAEPGGVGSRSLDRDVVRSEGAQVVDDEPETGSRRVDLALDRRTKCLEQATPPPRPPSLRPTPSRHSPKLCAGPYTSCVEPAARSASSALACSSQYTHLPQHFRTSALRRIPHTCRVRQTRARLLRCTPTATRHIVPSALRAESAFAPYRFPSKSSGALLCLASQASIPTPQKHLSLLRIRTDSHYTVIATLQHAHPHHIPSIASDPTAHVIVILPEPRNLSSSLHQWRNSIPLPLSLLLKSLSGATTEPKQPWLPVTRVRMSSPPNTVVDCEGGGQANHDLEPDRRVATRARGQSRRSRAARRACRDRPRDRAAAALRPPTVSLTRESAARRRRPGPANRRVPPVFGRANPPSPHL